MPTPLGPWTLSDGARDADAPADRPSLADLEAEVAAREASGAVDAEGRLVWGLALMAAGRFDDAESVFGPALAPPTDGRLHLMATVAARSAGRHAPRDQLEGLVDQLSKDDRAAIPDLWMAAGAVLTQAGLHDRAATAFDKAASLYSKESDTAGLIWALREAIQVAGHRARFDEADALMRRARRFSPNDETSLLLRLDEARLAALRARWDEAIAALVSALEIGEATLSPDHPLIDHALVSLAAARMERDGPTDASEQLLVRALGMRRARGPEATPENTEVMLLLGEHHRLAGRLDDALPLIARAALARASNGEAPQAAAHAFGVWSQALTDSGHHDAARDKRARAEALRDTAAPSRHDG